MKPFPATATMQDVIRERRADVAEAEGFRNNKLNGRIRTATRAAPGSHSDVVAGDAEGDVVVDSTYVYTLYSVSGTLKWHRVSLLVGW